MPESSSSGLDKSGDQSTGSYTFNDTVEEIQSGIAGFADTLPGVNKIHLLPYHRLGQDKYEGLGRNI